MLDTIKYSWLKKIFIKLHSDVQGMGLFEWIVMTFGLKNAGATYQRAMNYIFHEIIGKIVEIYIDDVLVKSKGYQEHLANVRPGAAGLLIGIECSRVRDSSWMYLTSFVTTRIGVGLAAVQRKLPDCDSNCTRLGLSM